MRLEGQSKLGYYPTPPATLALIQTWLARSADSELGGTPYEQLRRVLDPCCGQGEALAATACHVKGDTETFGIELSDARAKVAAACLDHVLNTAFEYARLSDETFSLVWNNPPYDGESMTGGGTRLEESFLLSTTNLLVPGGIHIYVIAHARLSEKIARHLAGWYEQLRCFKFAGGEYDDFHQVVIFGVRRKVYEPPTNDQQAAVMAWRDGQMISGYETVTVEAAISNDTPLLGDAEAKPNMKKERRVIYAPLPELVEGKGEYIVPPSPLRGKKGAAFRFQYEPQSEEDYLREADMAAAKLDASCAWRELVPHFEPPLIRPVITPKRGHIALQVSGGLLGTNPVKTADGQPLLLKGNVRKYSVANVQDVDAVTGDDEDDKLHKVEVDEKFETIISTLDAHGQLTTTSDPAAIGQLLETYVEQLASIVQTRNAPQYDMQPEAWEWHAFDHLSQTRFLPGRNEVGLTDFQRHLAIAMGRLCLTDGKGIVNAEMGSGKTTIALAIAVYLHEALSRQGKLNQRNPFPALVVGPGIVTGQENWPKEIAEVIPAASSRVITTGAKPQAKPIKIGAWLQALGLQLNEATFEGVDATQTLINIVREAERQGLSHFALAPITGSSKLPRHLKQSTQLPANLLTAALRQSLINAWQNPPPIRKDAKAPNLLDAPIGGGLLWTLFAIPRDENSAQELNGRYSVAQFLREYESGQLPTQSFAVLSYETAKLGAGRVPAMNFRRGVHLIETDEGEPIEQAAWYCVCPTCGQVVAEQYDEENNPIEPILRDEAEAFVSARRRFCQALVERRDWNADTGKHTWQRQPCGAPLFSESALHRVAAADYIARKARHAFGLLLVDEIHKAKAKGSGVGFALASLASHTRYTVGLTGTLFGGYSTSIFWLLYRLVPSVRREFAFNDDRRWASRYGLLKTVFYVGDPDQVTGDGTFTGTKFKETITERPGISPAIVGTALNHVTFSSLKDMKLPLPTYSEEVIRIPLSSAMQSQYDEADGSSSCATPRSGVGSHTAAAQDRAGACGGLLRWALERRKAEGGKGAISVWLTTALNRPDAMFRSEEVIFRPRFKVNRYQNGHTIETVRDFPAVCAEGEWLPKEQWLAETCLDEHRQGRRTLVYVRQTGTRDIQARWAEAMKSQGLRVGVLRPSLAPARRATWLKNHVKDFDVLIANARLVEVGLNLTMFSTAIFGELEWSLYVIWQAMRRLWRPGAPKPVKVLFPVYEGTLEEQMINLIGAKMRAASLFYGDEVGSALVEEEDDASLLQDLVRTALSAAPVGRAETIFGQASVENFVSESPTGSLIAPSPTFTRLSWEQANLMLKNMAATRSRNARKGKDNPIAQPSLLDLFGAAD